MTDLSDHSTAELQAELNRRLAAGRQVCDCGTCRTCRRRAAVQRSRAKKKREAEQNPFDAE